MISIKKCAAVNVWIFAAAILMAANTHARASFHLWKFDQVYSDATGTRQFIEMSCDIGGQQFFFSDAGGPFGPARIISSAGTFVFPHDLPMPADIGHDTDGQHLLLATSGFSPFGVKADFELPEHFFSTSADGLKFTPNDPAIVLDVMNWFSLPTDGKTSLHQLPGSTFQETREATAANFGGAPTTLVPLPTSVTMGLIGLALAVVAKRLAK
jgi:hypothetical protein